MKKENYTEETHETLTIPTREEFHRYASNTLSESDFCTDYPGISGYQINKVDSAIRWTLKNKKCMNLNYRRNY